MNFLSPPDWLLKMLPDPASKFLEAGGWYLVLAFAALVVLLVVGFVLRKFLGLFKGKKRDEDKPLRENLAEYPPPPKPGPRKLQVQGTPARVRLVVIAPVGKAAKLDANKAAPLLEHVARGLGAVVGQDKPRIKIWPPQLSNDGFIETFFRVVKSPDKEGKASRWVQMAGRAKVGESYILLGLALLSDETNNLGKLRPRAESWGDYLKVK
jgi:hypothetical protein